MIKNSLYKFSIFATLFLIIIIDEMSYGIIAPVLSSFVMDNQSIHLLSYHFNIAGRDLLYASLLGTVSLFLFISAPILGDISDAFGRKKTLLFMIAFSAVSYFVCALGVLLKNIPLLFVGHAAVGFTAGTASISQAAITDVSHHEEKVYNLSIITLALCFGFIAGPLIGGFFTTYPLSHSIGYASAYLIVTFLA
ncbi:MAG: MFS transporter, partial [Proteobacteria bacterium]|nr:MFS transporter [Pseudomonadota bacterium]